MNSPIIFRLTEALADRYRVDAELGAGGMATVYRAHDLKHGRDVAIKVLHPDLGAALGGERFLSEIRTTARLQHPHILPLLDSGVADGLLYYVMPLVTGETLRARLERERQLPVDDAVRIAREVAAALDHAHRQGVIHRDIKPENILLQDGSALVADFGIALAIQQAGGARLTQTGLSLGTPQYMSPEQATGDRVIDARSDVYALGAVTYEMLAGEPPFTGPSMQAILARLMTEEPRGLASQRRAIPGNVERAVLKALEKLPADRHGSAADYSIALTSIEPTGDGGTGPASRRAAPPSRLTWVLAAGIAGATAVGGFVTGSARQSQSVTEGGAVRLHVELPDHLELTLPDGGPRIALSADGRRLAMIGRLDGNDATRSLYLRELDRFDATPVSGTGSAVLPFFSPDGRKIGFIDRTTERLTVVDPSSTGLPLMVGDSTLRLGWPVWGTDGFVYAQDRSTHDGVLQGGIVRVNAETGAFEHLTIVKPDSNEQSHSRPFPLPNATGMLFVRIRRPSGDPRLRDVAVFDFATKRSRILTSGVAATYTAGHLLVVRPNGELQAYPFDEDRLEITGNPTLIASDVAVSGDNFSVDLQVTRSGTVVYAASGATAGAAELVWADRTGRIQPVDSSWIADFRSVAVSRDGRRIAATIAAGDREDIWIKSGPNPPVLLTQDKGLNRYVAWSADGNSVLAIDQSRPPFPLISRRIDGTGGPRIVAQESRSLASGIETPDGAWTVYRTSSATEGRGDILARRNGDSTVRQIAATADNERHATMSPDSKWIAYKVDANTGTGDVFIRLFADVTAGSWSIPRRSYAGTSDPVFSKRGKELFVINGDAELSSVEYEDATGFTIKRVTPLFTLPEEIRNNPSGQRYDVAPDGRFLMIRLVGVTSALHTRRRPRLVWITNVGALLTKTKMPS